MKKALYIGINTYGSTSKMRAEKMKDILADWDVRVIDTDIPNNKAPHLFVSLAWHYKIGPLIWSTNKYVLDNLGDEHYDLIWVDKAIYITKKTTSILRAHTDKLVHYTPDPAYTFHRSRLLFASLPYYDYVVTTKTYEIEDFVRAMGSIEKVLYATQGFDKNIHRPLVEWERKRGVAMIGHHEEERESPVLALLDAGIDVYLAGGKWETFAKEHACETLHYLGESVQGEDYVKALSGCLFALGSVSKWIPEKHTTRTFEIPACGTALLTEKNDEIAGFYNDNEVIYYANNDELVEKVRYYLGNKAELKEITDRGYKKVQIGGFDFESIMRNLLNKVLS